MSARKAGLVAALILALLFLGTIALSVGPENVVVPTNGVTASGGRDNPAGVRGLDDLQERTRRQQWPGESEPRTRSLALGPPARPDDPRAPGEQRVQNWLSDRGASRDLLQEPRFRKGVSSLPAPESAVLVQPQGRTWRRLHNDQIAYGGALYVFGISLLIAIFLAWRGRIPIKEGESGRTIERFTAFERANHWLTAGSFLLIALTGLVILYGNGLVRPWLGAGAYAELAGASVWSHMTFAVPFFLGVIVMIGLWTRQNIPEWLDWEWLKRGGGFISDDQESPPARKFNAGQKLVFWAVALGGSFLMATGVGLMFPFFWTGYTGMQLVQVLHAAAGLLMIGVIIGHIYIGTIGMRGAFDAMWGGRVDRNWAKEHHSLWYRSVAEDAASSTEDLAAGATRPRSGAGAFVAGAALAVALAVAMAVVYQMASITDTKRTASSNPSVHLSSDDTERRQPLAARRP